MRILLLGSTDLTLAVANKMLEMDIGLVGVVHVKGPFRISYAPGGQVNAREVDIGIWCEQHDIPAREYENAQSIISAANATDADILLAAGWYHMLGREVRARFALGAIGLHASLLPKFKGGAPLNWAILSGENETGITLFELGSGVDDGRIYGQKRFPITTDTTITELVEAAEAGALELIAECLPGIADRSLKPWPQRGTASYGLQRIPEDGRIDWALPASSIHRLVRAVSHPYPGAMTRLDERTIFIWRTSRPIDPPVVLGCPGQIARLPEIDAPCVVTGEGIITIVEATDEDGDDIIPMLARANHRRLV